MQIGIFGTVDDPQCQHLAEILEQRGCSVLLLDANAIHYGMDHTLLEGAPYCQEYRLDEIPAYYVRHVTSPMAPAVEVEDSEEPILFRDWFNEYMHQRGRQELIISFLLLLEERGVCLVNPPFAGSVNQYKPFQIGSVQDCGIPVPRTVLTNNPDRVQEFKEEVGAVVYKPSTGGALCELLDDEKMEELELIRQSPVIFQERIPGDDIRVVVVNGEVVSSVAVDSSVLDFRDDPNYSSGQGTYREVELSDEVKGWCRQAAKVLGLRFTGIDLKHRAEEDFVFIEANSSPIYLDVELKMGHNITERLADYLMEQASTPIEARGGEIGLKKHQGNF